MGAVAAVVVLDSARDCHSLSNLWCPCRHPRQLPMVRAVAEAVAAAVAVAEVVVVIVGKEATTSSISEAVAVQPAKQW